MVPFGVYALSSRRAGLDPAVRQAGWLLLATATTYVAFFVATGGDWMPAWRFFAPAVPLLAAVITVTWAATSAKPGLPAAPGRVAAATAAAATAVLLASSVTNPVMVPRVVAWHEQVVELAELGSWLHRTLPPGTVISTFANGALSFHAGTTITVIDQLGLTDEHIARNGKRNPTGLVGHAAFDYDYVINQRRPAVVVTTGDGLARAPTCAVPSNLGDQYVGRTFRFDTYQVDGKQLWAVIALRTERADELTTLLNADPAFQLDPCP